MGAELCYTVDNGIRQVPMVLTRHVPSHLVIAEQRVLISYDGQPTTFYGCRETGHIYPTCPGGNDGHNCHPSRRLRRMQRLQPPCPYQPGINRVPAHKEKAHQDSTVRWRVTGTLWIPSLPTLNAVIPPWTQHRVRRWGTPKPLNLLATGHSKDRLTPHC